MGLNRNSGKVTLFSRLRDKTQDIRGWTTQDIADLYRIGEQLTKLGFPVGVHTGESDEGDPWAIFVRSSTDQIIVHVARIDHELVIVDIVRDTIYRGKDFRALADELLEAAPMVLPRTDNRDNVVLHPRMVMMSFVAATFVLADFAEVKADTAHLSDLPEEKELYISNIGFSIATSKGDSEKVVSRDNLIVTSWGNAAALGGLAASLAAFSAGLSSNEHDKIENDSVNSSNNDFSVVLSNNYNNTIDSIEEESEFYLLHFANNEKGVIANESAALEKYDKTDILHFDVWVDPAPEHSTRQQTGHYRDEVNASTIIIFEADTQDLKLVDLEQEEYYQELNQSDANILSVSSVDNIQKDQVFSLVMESTFTMELKNDSGAKGAIVISISDLEETLQVNTDLIENFSNSLDGRQTPPEIASSHPDDGEKGEQYILLSKFASSVEITSDAANVLVYAGGDVNVFGFTFGRDSIVVLEGVTPENWLLAIDVVGTDVVLIGQNGSVVLYDSLAAFA